MKNEEFATAAKNTYGITDFLHSSFYIFVP